jgi:hypothetical protein
LKKELINNFQNKNVGGEMGQICLQKLQSIPPVEYQLGAIKWHSEELLIQTNIHNTAPARDLSATGRKVPAAA